jgi:pimeloyl-ACP methyl ester carboxylesterase
MGILDVPGAGLYYEETGEGPLMVLIPGGNGTAHIYRGLARELAARFTVVTYDRRGFSRSRLDGPQDDEHRLETDADDVRRLIEHRGGGPAVLFGPSSGAIVALTTVTRAPSVVGQLVAYEPPALRQLAEGQRWIELFSDVYSVYREGDMAGALDLFFGRVFPPSDRQFLSRTLDLTNHEIHANWRYWFERELRQYTAATLDVQALEAHADRIVLAAGRASQGYLCYEVSSALATRLGQDLTELPGGHTGYATQPAEFAVRLLQALGRPGGR